MKFKPLITLLLILLLAFTLRIYNITTNPPELFPDELVNSESAKSIIETGKDLEGELHVYFSDRVEFRPPLYGYQTYPFIKIFGNNPFAIRLPAIINGLFTIFILYLLILEITKKQTPALLGALSLAIIPWHIHYSRLGFEPAAFLPLLLTALLFMIKAINHHKPNLLLISFIFFALSSYTYFGSPLFAFLFLSITIILNRKFLFQNKLIFISGLILYALLISPIYYLANTQSTFFDRANRIYTFKDGINTESINIFFNNYFSHFTLDFLFFNGDPNLRHGAQTGVLFFWMLPFILAGMYYITFYLRPKWLTIFFYLWLLLFPFGGAITNDGVPHATRTLIGAPLFAILSGIGIWFVFHNLYQKTKSAKLIWISVIILSLIGFIYLIRFSNKYFNHYPVLSQHHWQYGHQQVFSKVKNRESNYQYVCLGNLDYWGTKPLLAHHLNDSSLQPIENINDPVCSKPGTLIVVKPAQPVPGQAKLIDEVIDLNGVVLYRIFAIN